MILDKYLGFVPKISISIKNSKLSSYDNLCLKAYNTWKEHFKNNYSKIIELFYGQFISEIRQNEDISYTFDPFNTILLEIPKDKDSVKIEDCLDEFISKEKIGNNIEKNFNIWKAPKILCITLKRFHQLNGKNTEKVIYKDKLDLSKYCKGVQRQDIVYNLIGICCHEGSLDFGHYYSICRKNKSNKWYKYDDTNVSLITENGIIPLTRSAYILFYELDSLE
jgi:ubiquitin C-terminal hydrolase